MARPPDQRPEDHFRWGVMLVECVRKVRLRETHSPWFVDQEVMPHFDGRAEDMFVWFICRRKEERERFDLRLATGAVRDEMKGAGFPMLAIETLRTGVTSLEEIEAGGGKFYFFR